MAFIGVAFSLGFIFGPLIGAAFSAWGKGQSEQWFLYPAMMALTLSILDVAFIALFFKVYFFTFLGYHSYIDLERH